jgi:hypothetical protein
LPGQLSAARDGDEALELFAVQFVFGRIDDQE